MMSEDIATDKEIIVCLYYGEYHYGVAALANSLVASNFTGLIHIGYQGVLPPWVKQLRSIDESTFYITKDVIIKFEAVETEMNLAFYKPFFIKQTFDNLPSANKIYYFDVDIVINASWSFFSKWLDNHVCLCLDNAFEYVHDNHPWRKDWKRLANVEDNFSNPETAYVNSGFIGISRTNLHLVDKWIDLTNKFQELGGSLKVFFQDGHLSYKGDQDLLNAAITVCPAIKLSLIGKEGMGFKQPEYLMTHALSKNKPWDKNFLKHLVKYGHKPSFPEKNFFNYCKYPINLFSKNRFRIKKFDLFLASLFGRYFGY
jgi:hypothetical protein